MFSRPLVLTFSLLALQLSLAPAVATSAEAQGQAQPLSKYRFQALDDNKDGRITRDEWDGNERSFRNHDWNGDGVLSGNEVRPGAQRVTELADHDPNRFERNLNWSRANFTSLDHNRDGRLAANEWHFDLETFRRVDADRNNSISLQEFLGEGVEDVRDNSFDDMDWNNNGRVERAEWFGGSAEFNRLDVNRDGVLSRYEVVGGQDTSFDTYDQFQNLDYDRNGTLSRAEWHWSNNSFAVRDRNRDGLISRQEFEVAGGAPGSTTATAAGSQTVRVNSQHRWTDSGITVRAGDVITFNASGTITMSDDQGDTATPAGSTRGRRAPDAPILNQLAGGLLAKIGEYPTAFIGSRGTWTAPVSGRLYLGVNDDHLPDNRGEFTVVVGVQGRTLR
jgi:EF hand domain-containing protein